MENIFVTLYVIQVIWGFYVCFSYFKSFRAKFFFSVLSAAVAYISIIWLTILQIKVIKKKKEKQELKELNALADIVNHNDSLRDEALIEITVKKRPQVVPLLENIHSVHEKAEYIRAFNKVNPMSAEEFSAYTSELSAVE